MYVWLDFELLYRPQRMTGLGILLPSPRYGMTGLCSHGMRNGVVLAAGNDLRVAQWPNFRTSILQAKNIGNHLHNVL